MLAQVEQSFRSQAGGASFCQLQKDGRVTGGVKYDEGRLVALHWARRIIAAGGQDGIESCGEAIAAERKTWEAALDAVCAKEPPPMAWIAYRQGGVDALTWALAFIQHRAGQEE